MVETTRKHICDQCGNTYTEGEKTPSMFPLAEWKTVKQHHCAMTMVFPKSDPIFCSYKCLSEWAYKQALKQIN